MGLQDQEAFEWGKRSGFEEDQKLWKQIFFILEKHTTLTELAETVRNKEKEDIH